VENSFHFGERPHDNYEKTSKMKEKKSKFFFSGTCGRDKGEMHDYFFHSLFSMV
jgi:hypothetical protein